MLIPLSDPDSALVPDFVAGSENRLTWFTFQSDESICQRGNPLLLVGPSGSGKSAVAATLFEKELAHADRGSAIALPAVDYARQYSEAIETGTVPSFRETHLSASLLLIEDLQLIADKTAAQDELSRCFEFRIDHDLPTIVTSRLMPTSIPRIRSHLASRLLPGLTIPMSPPNRVSREQIIRSFAQCRDVTIDDEVVDRLLAKIPEGTAVPMICAVVQQLIAFPHASDDDSDDDNSFVDALASLTVATKPSMALITKVVARKFGLKIVEIKSSSRRKKVVRARALAMYFCRTATEESLQSIGDFFGGRDHSTVIHAIRSTTEQIESDPSVALLAKELSDSLNDV